MALVFPWFLRNQAFPGKGRAGKGHLARPARWRDIFGMDRCFRRQARAIGFFAAALAGLALAGWGTWARASVGLGELASRPPEALPGGERPWERLANPLVLRVQKALAESGRYRGPVNGRMNAVLEAAIRAYQKSTGLKVDGRVSEALAGQMETGAKVAGLLKRLQRTRHDNIETARRALLDQPATRRLITGDDGGTAETADPTRDAAQCFRDPTVRCLLAEASESAKAIYKPEMRDWALGEILAAQAKAGFAKEAMQTVARIGDPRLIMVALRNIAKAQAASGRGEEALAAAEIVPDAGKRVEAFAAIAAIHIQGGDKIAAKATVRRLLADLAEVENRLTRVTYHARAAVILSLAGDARTAEENLKAAGTLARSLSAAAQKGAALRHVASALAEMNLTERALGILGEVDADSERTPVLIATAISQAKGGDAAQALLTAESIDAVRYRAVVLSRIAQAQAKAGDRTAARETVNKAKAAAESIELRYARDYAASRIAFAGQQIDNGSGGKDFDEAVKVALTIGDDRLRAQTLWTISAQQGRAGDNTGARRTEKLAETATNDIKSSLSQVWMFCEIAMNHSAADERDAAWRAFGRGMAVAEKVNNVWGRARVLGKLAATMVGLTRIAQMTL